MRVYSDSVILIYYFEGVPRSKPVPRPAWEHCGQLATPSLPAIWYAWSAECSRFAWRMLFV